MKGKPNKKAITIDDLAHNIVGLTGTVNGLTQTVDNLAHDVGDLTKTVDGLTGTVNGLTQTVDNLARMTAKGFDEAQKNADERFKLIVDRFERVESDTSDIKRVLGPLVQVVAIKDREMHDIQTRLGRVERKVGLSK